LTTCMASPETKDSFLHFPFLRLILKYPLISCHRRAAHQRPPPLPLEQRKGFPLFSGDLSAGEALCVFEGEDLSSALFFDVTLPLPSPPSSARGSESSFPFSVDFLLIAFSPGWIELLYLELSLIRPLAPSFHSLPLELRARASLSL